MVLVSNSWPCCVVRKVRHHSPLTPLWSHHRGEVWPCCEVREVRHHSPLWSHHRGEVWPCCEVREVRHHSPLTPLWSQQSLHPLAFGFLFSFLQSTEREGEGGRERERKRERERERERASVRVGEWKGDRLLVACLTSQQQANVSQGRECTDNFTCCHTEIEVADPTFYLTQSQYTDTGPTSTSADPIMPGAWQNSHWNPNLKNPSASGIRTPDLPLPRRTPLPLGQRGG